MAQVKIHRGTHQIGGCSTEISTENNRVFIDFGDNLPGVVALPLQIDGLTFGNSSASALFFTHYHGDHVGRLADVLPDVPVYMGKTAKAIQINLEERRNRGGTSLFARVLTFEPGSPVIAGDIAVLPLMIDHSAFDAYMFLIQAGGKRILHTGDFRFHGVRGGKTRFMLKNWARNIDYLICEGTTLSRSVEPPMSEHELRENAAEMMRDAKYVFVLCSSTHIDRIGAFYHANPPGRLFVCDEYQKKQLETVRQNHAGKSDFYDFRYVYSYGENLDKRMKEKGFCMLVRQGEFFRRVMEKYKNECIVIYSMWTGYLDERSKNQELVDFLAPYHYRVLHTSGHASPEDIKTLYETVKPKRGLIPIHTDAPEKFAELIPEGTIILLDDGEEFEI